MYAVVCWSLNFFVKMDEDWWMYDKIISEEVNIN